MRGLPKSKRISWASDVNLCQVRLFLSEESPLQVGLGVGAQDHLQAKASGLLHSTGSVTDDNLPPGFEGAQPVDLLKNKLSQIHLTTWRCPPRFVLDYTWQVVAGEESKEMGVQNQREMRVLEAIFPRPSAIPANPSVLTGIEDTQHNDHQTPMIPITPIEDEESAADTTFDSATPNTTTMVSQPPQLASGIPSTSHVSTGNYPNPSAIGNLAAGMVVSGVESGVSAAAYAALTAAKTTNNQGNLIDHDLLIKILSDPKLTEKLVINPQIMPKSSLPGINFPNPPSIDISRAEACVPKLAATPNLPFCPSPNMVRPIHSPLPPPPPPPVAKDMNYYKSLIQQHGGERPEIVSELGGFHNQQLVPNFGSVNKPRPRDSKPKIMKPCTYFNSSRGCRHGANCSYQHDVSAQQRRISMPEMQSAKRMKVDREITGL